jgi:uncharacterized protein (TIGR02217 family)
MAVQSNQLAVSVLVKAGGADIRAVQQQLSVLSKSGTASVKAVQTVVTSLIKVGLAPSNAWQIVICALVGNIPVSTPPIFPQLIQEGYDVMKRPNFYNSQAKSGSGWTTRVSYSENPTWEWDLTYEVLEDTIGVNNTPLKTILGFFLGMGGSLVPFCYLDPDDNTVTSQLIGTGDGSTKTWTLQRTYGYGQTGTEPVGYLVSGATFNAYVNGTLQSSSTYTLNTATPVQQQISFTSAPASGAPITVDMQYYYYAHFKEDSWEFGKFGAGYWYLKKITIESLRG